MKHNFEEHPEGQEADNFLKWLQSETETALKKDYGNLEATKASIFLFTQRAYEAQMPEKLIITVFVKSALSAGFTEEEEEALFTWLEQYAEVAKNVNNHT